MIQLNLQQFPRFVILRQCAPLGLLFWSRQCLQAFGYVQGRRLECRNFGPLWILGQIGIQFRPLRHQNQMVRANRQSDRIMIGQRFSIFANGIAIHHADAFATLHIKILVDHVGRGDQIQPVFAQSPQQIAKGMARCGDSGVEKDLLHDFRIVRGFGGRHPGWFGGHSVHATDVGSHFTHPVGHHKRFRGCQFQQETRIQQVLPRNRPHLRLPPAVRAGPDHLQAVQMPRFFQAGNEPPVQTVRAAIGQDTTTRAGQNLRRFGCGNRKISGTGLYEIAERTRDGLQVSHGVGQVHRRIMTHHVAQGRHLFRGHPCGQRIDGASNLVLGRIQRAPVRIQIGLFRHQHRMIGQFGQNDRLLVFHRTPSHRGENLWLLRVQHAQTAGLGRQIQILRANIVCLFRFNAGVIPVFHRLRYGFAGFQRRMIVGIKNRP